MISQTGETIKKKMTDVTIWKMKLQQKIEHHLENKQLERREVTTQF